MAPADQVTLNQGGQIMTPHHYWPPRIFRLPTALSQMQIYSPLGSIGTWVDTSPKSADKMIVFILNKCFKVMRLNVGALLL